MPTPMSITRTRSARSASITASPSREAAATPTAATKSRRGRRGPAFRARRDRLPYIKTSGRLADRHCDLEQRPILLAAEDVRIAQAAAGDRAQDRELDRQCRVELHVICDAALGNAEEPTNRRPRQRAGATDEIIVGPLGENHVEGDLVDPDILAADRLCDIGKLAHRR